MLIKHKYKLGEEVYVLDNFPPAILKTKIIGIFYRNKKVEYTLANCCVCLDENMIFPTKADLLMSL